MSFARLILTTAALGLLPALALAQAAPAAAPPVQPVAQAPAAPPVPTTQNVTVTEPDLGALKPTPPPPVLAMPHWSEFPQAPAKVPTVADFANRVHAQEADSGQLDAIGRAIVWEVFQPDAITAAANAQLDPSKMGPVDAEMTAQQSDALAKALRDTATAPPVAQ